MMNIFKGKRTKRMLLIFGVGTLSFMILIGVAAITLAVLNVFLNDYEFDEYTIAFIALSAFALIVTLAVVILLYLMAQKSQTLIDSLNRVAEGDYSTEIEFSRTDTFAGVYRNFNNMIKELNSVKTMRDDFVHNFSHEIKTPLFSIQGFANLLLEGGLTEEEQHKFLKIISDEAGRMFKLADSTLTLSKLENQHIVGERKTLKLNAELNECIVMLEREWEEKGVEVVADLYPVKIVGDKILLGQVWLNLISNAIKFTPKGGKVEVTLRRENNTAVVTVKDTGRGISPDDIPKIFDKYYRSETASDVEGNGLGLAICKRICSLSGGEISVDSRLGEGSCFTVKLPITAL